MKTGNKEKFLKNKITDICNIYKAAASLAAAAAADNNIELVKKLHKNLREIFSFMTNTIELYNDPKITEKIRNNDFENLPDWLSYARIADYCRKMTALKYTNTDCNDIENQIMINKMAIELNPEEEISYLKIARTLYEQEKYTQALELCEYIKTISNTAPVWSLSGDIYRSLGKYDKSIDSYLTYVKLNEDDEKALKTLDEIYEEALN